MMEQKNMLARQAKNLRYKKPLHRLLNLETIQETLWDIQEQCETVRWRYNEEEEAITEALDGNEEEAKQFELEFADLEADCEQLLEDLQNSYIPQYFNDFFVLSEKSEGLIGWDSYERDYLPITYKDMAKEVSGKRLLRLTKEDLLQTTYMCMQFAISFQSLLTRYDHLKAVLDIISGDYVVHLQTVTSINTLYDTMMDETKSYKERTESERKYNEFTQLLPQDTWL